jgi:alanyl-tRNA synthetase
MKRDQQTIMNGADAFRLHDTYGFPLDLTAKILNERGLGVDEAGFSVEMETQRQRSQQATREQRAGGSGLWGELDLPKTVFTGYTETQTFARPIAIVADNAPVDDVTEGDRVQIVFDQTCFYGESGGQVGDSGTFVGPHGTVRILDTQKPLPNLFVHHGVVESGVISGGDAGEISVDVLRRRDIMRNHTATHLLHRALRDVLGEHAEQAGSLVAPERLRFDFGHPQSLSIAELQEIERRVNAWIRADTEVSPARCHVLPLSVSGQRVVR